MRDRLQDIFSLRDEVAVVTGGYGNLGPWWVKALLDANAIVTIIELPNLKIPIELQKLQKEYKKKVRFYEADITDLNNFRSVHKKINKEVGLVSILVNNAGIDVRPSKITKKPDRSQEVIRFRKMWDVNVQGIVNCIEEFLPDMIKKESGSIINIGSLYAEVSPHEGIYNHLGFDKPWAYGATKAAVVQTTRHYATRLAKYGIRVNSLSPGGVLGSQDKEFIRKYSERVPLGRMVEKDKDLAGPLIFLASDASSYVTGINLQVDGGYTAW